MDKAKLLRDYALRYNKSEYFQEDPIIFPKEFSNRYKQGKACLADIEICAAISAHLAWGRRSLIVRDITKAMEEMNWKPYDYVMGGEYKDDSCSLHRTVKWEDFAKICSRLRSFYMEHNSLEILSPEQMRTEIYGQKDQANCANKKIHMLRRWMVRDDGKVDLGIWKNIDKRALIIPLDVHVHRSSLELEITSRKQVNYTTSLEITEYLKTVFPDDPIIGDFALFGYGIFEKKL